MNLTEKVQHRFAEQNKDKAFDVVTIAVIAGLILQLIDLWRKCRQTPAQALSMCKNPTFLQRFRLRRMARAELGNEGYSEYGDVVINAMLESGKSDITEEDIERAFNEIV